MESREDSQDDEPGDLVIAEDPNQSVEQASPAAATPQSSGG